MDDLISRREALYAINKTFEDTVKDINRHGNAYGLISAVTGIYKNTICLLPSAEPEPKRGKWIYTGIEQNSFYCDKCLYLVKNMSYKFCPNCGADMRTARQIMHDAIDNTPMAEDAYPGIKERLHEAVDEVREVKDGN